MQTSPLLFFFIRVRGEPRNEARASHLSFSCIFHEVSSEPLSLWQANCKERIVCFVHRMFFKLVVPPLWATFFLHNLQIVPLPLNSFQALSFSKPKLLRHDWMMEEDQWCSQAGAHWACALATRGNLYHPLASLINNKAQLQNCLDIYKPKGRCTSVVSVVLLVIGVEKKTCPISRFYGRSDRQPSSF